MCARIVSRTSPAARRVEPGEMLARRLPLGRREALGRPADGERLERQPHLEQVAELVDVESSTRAP